MTIRVTTSDRRPTPGHPRVSYRRLPLLQPSPPPFAPTSRYFVGGSGCVESERATGVPDRRGGGRPQSHAVGRPFLAKKPFLVSSSTVSSTVKHVTAKAAASADGGGREGGVAEGGGGGGSPFRRPATPPPPVRPPSLKAVAESEPDSSVPDLGKCSSFC